MGIGHKQRPKLLIDFYACFDVLAGFVDLCNLMNLGALIKEPYKNMRAKDIHEMRIKQASIREDLFNCSDIQMYIDEVERTNAMDIYVRSPKVESIYKLIRVFCGNIGKDANMSGLCEAIAWNKQQMAILKNHFPTLTVLDGSGKVKNDFSQYARIIIDKSYDMTKFEGARFTLFAVLSYAENFKLMDTGAKAISNIQALSKLHYTNQFELIDPI